MKKYQMQITISIQPKDVGQLVNLTAECTDCGKVIDTTSIREFESNPDEEHVDRRNRLVRSRGHVGRTRLLRPIMKTWISFGGILVGAAIIVTTTAIAIVFPRWGFLFGPAVLVALALAAKLESAWYHGKTQCGEVVAWKLGEGNAYCVRPIDHTGDCAAPLAALESIGYSQTPF